MSGIGGHIIFKDKLKKAIREVLKENNDKSVGDKTEEKKE